MLGKHAGARLLKILGDPPVDIRFGSDQYIQCSMVTPEPNRELPVFTNPDVPDAVRTYYEHWSVRQTDRTYIDANWTLLVPSTTLALPDPSQRSIGMAMKKLG